MPPPSAPARMPAELASKPFAYSFDAGLKTQGLERESKYYLKGHEAEAASLYPDEVLVTFEEDATDADVATFLEKYGASVVKREKKLVAKEDGSTVESGDSQVYVIKFEDGRVAFDSLGTLAAENGMHGEYVFADKRSAKAMQQIFKIEKSKKAYKVRHIGINGGGTQADSTDFLEGTGYITPGGTPFWFMRKWDPYAGVCGNRINPEGLYPVWDYVAGNGVRVAVIDNGFMAPGELYSQQLVGSSGTVWFWNFENNTSEIRVGCGHGRGVASEIFSRLNDGHSTAGVAPYAYPYLYHVGSSPEALDQNQIANAVNSARNNGVKVINMSFSSAREWWMMPAWMWAYYGAIHDAYNAGVIMVASTGNQGDQECYPAAYGEVVGVSAHDASGSVSVWGADRANTWYADIYAGGTGIAIANADPYPNIGLTGSNGTSMAAPIVAGACALYVQQGKISNTDTAITKLRNDAWYMGGRAYLDVWWGVTH